MSNKLVVTFDDDTIIVDEPYVYIFHNIEDVEEFLEEKGCWDVWRSGDTLYYKIPNGLKESAKITKAKLIG